MKQTIVLGTGIFISALVFSYVVFLLPVSANGDEHDESSEVTTAETNTTDIKRMETLISVLKQLLALMTEYKKQYPGASFTVPAVATPAMPDHHAESSATPVASDHHAESATTEQDESDEEEVTPAVPKLVIEIEEHSGKTHAHVRFIDGRPEAMFFVDAPMSNEDAIVSGISAQTGLGKEEVKNALKYMGM
jgi:hypothetical protein